MIVVLLSANFVGSLDFLDCGGVAGRLTINAIDNAAATTAITRTCTGFLVLFFITFNRTERFLHIRYFALSKMSQSSTYVTFEYGVN
jgi:hypothetical protein